MVLNPIVVITVAYLVGVGIAWWRGHRDYQRPEVAHRRAMRALAKAVTPPR